MDSIVKQWTGLSDAYWIARIGKLIGKHAKPGDIPTGDGRFHDEVNLNDWVSEFFREFNANLQTPPPYDGNMRFAAAASYILMKWFIRLVRAKAYDPRRRIEDRQHALNYLASYGGQITQMMLDESLDQTYFPDQQWESPFIKGATNGVYR